MFRTPLQEVIVASRDKAGGLYLVVPKQFTNEVSDALHERKIRHSSPRETKRYALFEMTTSPIGVDSAILDWLKERRLVVNRQIRGDAEDPDSIYWRITGE